MAKFTIIFILIYALGAVLSFINGAHWAFYLYQLVYFFNPEHRWWGAALPSIGYSMVTVIILAFMFFKDRRIYNRNKFNEMPQFKWFVMLIILYFLTYYVAVDKIWHEKAMINFLKMLVTIAIAYRVLDSVKKLEWSLLAYVVGAGYIGYEAFVLGRNSGDRLEGIGLVDAPEANGTAAAIVAAIPLIIYFLWWGNNKIKLLMLILGPLIVNAIILINSRGSFLGAAAGIVYFMFTMFFSRFKFSHQKKVAFLFVLLGVSTILVLVDESFINRMNSMIYGDERSSGSHRTEMWMATFDLLEDHPFGVGAFGFEKLSRIYVPPELFFGGKTRKAVHSIWFQALAEIGWIGFLIFSLIVITTFQSINKVKKRCKELNDHRLFYLSHALKSSFITLLVTSSFINQFRVQIVYWNILFIVCLHSIVINQTNSDYTNATNPSFDTADNNAL